MSVRVLIVGGDAAGMSAASRIRRADRSIEVTVLEREDVVSYAACGMPYHLDGRIARPETLLVRSPAQFEKAGIRVLTGHEVTEVDADAGRVRTGGGDGEAFSYDRLLLATGARPIVPRIEGVDAENVFVFRRYGDLLDLSAYLRLRDCRRVTVVGGGYVGIELAEVLTLRGCVVTLIEAADTVLPRTMDPEMARRVEQELQERGVRLRLAAPAQGLVTDGARATHVTTSEGEMECDVVILALGIRPGSELAGAAGIALDDAGAITTDAELRTSADGVWAAGDCTGTISRVTGKRVWVPLGPAAGKQGRIAGSNMAGGHETFPGVMGTALLKAFDLEVGRTGLTESEAREAGIDASTVLITAHDRASYYPGARETTVKLVAESSTGRLLGGQIIGYAGVAGRTNVVATALQGGMDVEAFSELDLGYAPPFAPVWDPLIVAANRFGRS